MSRCRCVLGFSASATVSLFCFCLLFQGVRVGCLFQPNFGLERAKYHSPCGFFRFWMRNCAGLVHSSTALIYMRIEPVSCWLGTWVLASCPRVFSSPPPLLRLECICKFKITIWYILILWATTSTQIPNTALFTYYYYTTLTLPYCTDPLFTFL